MTKLLIIIGLIVAEVLQRRVSFLPLSDAHFRMKKG
jgi:hypothetical protein